MADSRSTLIQRVVSAVLAGAIVLSLGYFGGAMGLYIVCTIAIVLGIREYSRMVFATYKMPSSVNLVYWLASILFYGLMIRDAGHG